MLHNKAYLLLIVLSSFFSTIFAANRAQLADNYNGGARTIKKIESKIIDLQRKKSIINVLINPIRVVAILLTLRAGFSLVGKLCGLASVNDQIIFESACFSVPLLLAIDKALSMSKDWSEEDIDDLQKELDKRNADISPKESIFFSTNK